MILQPQGRDSSAAATATLQGLLGIKGQISPSQTPVPNLRSHSQGKGRAGEDATQQEPKEARQAGKQAEASPMGAGGLSAIWEKLRAQTQLPAGSALFP